MDNDKKIKKTHICSGQLFLIPYLSFEEGVCDIEKRGGKYGS
jgi:hypothetical protein